MRWVLLLLLACPVNAQKLKNWAPQFQNKFCGLDTLHDSAYLDDCDAQLSQNVLTDRGYLEERPGNVAFATILNGSPNKQLYEFVSLANTRYLIAHVGNNVYATNLSSAPVVISTISPSQNLECTPLYGKLICDDGAGAMWAWDGTSTTTVNGGAPICNLLATEYGRVFCGAPTSDLSQVAVSSYPSYNVWTPSPLTPLPPNSATSFEFSPNDGDQILCLKPTPWGLFVGKRNSSYILKGYDNTTFFVQTIDPIIGCVDQRTFQMVNGLATWMSQKGVYQWPGNGPPVWISEKIDPTFRGIRQLASNANFWQLSSPGDWQSGTFTTNGPKNTWDATSVPGYILPSSSVFLNNANAAFSSGTLTNAYVSSNSVFAIAQLSLFPNGNFETGTSANWANFVSDILSGCGAGTLNSSISNSSPLEGSYSALLQTPGCALRSGCVAADDISSDQIYVLQDGNGATIANGGLTADGAVHVATISLSGLTTNYIRLVVQNDANMSGVGTQYVANITSNYILIPTIYSSMTFTYKSSKNSDASCNGGGNGNDVTTRIDLVGFSSSFSSGTFVSSIFDTQFSTPTYGVFSATYPVAAQNVTGQVVFYTRVSTSPNNDMWDAYAAASDTVKLGSSAKRYLQYESILTNFISTGSASFSAVSIPSVSTGIYYSPVDFIGTAITAFKQFNVQDFQQTPGELQYYVRSASYSFTALQTAPPWSAQINNTVVAVATGTYFEWKVDSSSITSSSQAVTTANASINRSIVNWQEGLSIKPASGFMDQRYFLCTAVSTADAVNDACLVYQRNRQWTLFNGPSVAAMTPFNFKLVGGSGNSDSRVWYMMQDGVYDDAGSAINSSWTSKDFIIGSAFNLKSFYELWTDNQYSQGATLNVGYALDKGGMNFRTFALDSSANNPTQLNLNTVVTRTGPAIGISGGKYIRFNFNQNLLDLPWRLNSYMFYVDVQERTAS